MDEKNVEVTFANGVLTIKGEKQEEREEKKKSYYMRERSSGSFERTFQVSEGIDTIRSQQASRRVCLQSRCRRLRRRAGLKERSPSKPVDPYQNQKLALDSAPLTIALRRDSVGDQQWSTEATSWQAPSIRLFRLLPFTSFFLSAPRPLRLRSCPPERSAGWRALPLRIARYRTDIWRRMDRCARVRVSQTGVVIVLTLRARTAWPN